MSKLALKIVEAIQHSLLGSLLVNLVWPLWFFFQADRVTGGPLNPFYGWVSIAMVATVFIAWLLGSIAKGAQRAVSAMDRLHKDAANGFDVWTTLPDGGLRPSAPMRTFVLWLGRRPERKLSFIEISVFGATILLLVSGITLIAWGMDVDDALARVHPWLGERGNQQVLCYWGSAIYSLIHLRIWASRQRANLAPIP